MVRSSLSGSDNSEHDSDSSYPSGGLQSPTSPGIADQAQKKRRVRHLTTPEQSRVLNELLAQVRMQVMIDVGFMFSDAFSFDISLVFHQPLSEKMWDEGLE
jgi:hypothetical protein